MNPHALIRALAPQASASANSATRTSAEGTLATGDPIPHIGSGPDAVPGWGHVPGRRAAGQPSYDPSYDPAGEVVDLCRDLIRIDTTNYGDESGPGERKAAEHVAGAARRGRDRVRAVRARQRPYVAGGAWGGPRRRGRAAAARPPRRRAGRGRGLAGRPVLRGDPGRLRLGSRRGRHEGLRRDAALGGAGPGARRRGARAADRARASPPTRRRAATTARRCWSRSTPSGSSDCTEAIGEVGGFTTTIRGRRLYLIETAEKGMAWMRLTARGRAGHGSMINDDNAVTGSSAAVARIGATSGRSG